MLGSNANRYTTVPTLSSISKGPMNLGDSFPRLPNLTTLRHQLQEDVIPNLELQGSTSHKVPYVSLHPAPVVLMTKILVHLRATWMHGKPRAVKLLENLLSQIGRMGNHYPSPIPKTTICVDGPALVTRT